jgi:hypothetical protein
MGRILKFQAVCLKNHPDSLEPVQYLIGKAKNQLSEDRFRRPCSVNIEILTKKPVK